MTRRRPDGDERSRSGGRCRPSSMPDSPDPSRPTAGWALCVSRRSPRCVRIRRSPRAHVKRWFADWSGFQEHLFSSVRVRNLARALAAGEPLPNTDPPLSAVERAREGHVRAILRVVSRRRGPDREHGRTLPSRAPTRSAARPAGFRQRVRADPTSDAHFSMGCRLRICRERTYVVTRARRYAAELVTSDPGQAD